MNSDDFNVPRSAYSKAYPDFDRDLSFSNIDDVEGDISLSRDMNRGASHQHIDSNNDSDSSFDELLDDEQVESLEGRKNTVFQEPASLIPRGYEFKLKNTGCLVYLTYPVNTIDIDSYGKIEYELHTKDKSMVVIIPNSKGLSVNNRKLADAYSIRTGCVVAVVDVYFHDPLNMESPPSNDSISKNNHDNGSGSFIDKIKNYTVEVAMNVKVNYWLQSHSVFGPFIEEENKFQITTNWNILKEVIQELLTTHEVENAIIIGFSFGANTAARLAIESNDDRIKSVVLVHPLFLPKNALEHIQKSVLLIVGNEDSFYSQKDLDKFNEDLIKKRDPFHFKYLQLKLKENSPHGFAISGDYSPMKIGNLPSKTCEKVVSWVLSKI